MIANIEKLRKNKGYNQDEIANKLDIARQTYSKIESWKKEITLWIVVKLAEILGVEVWEILWEDFSVKEKKEIDWDKYKQIVRFCIENGTWWKFKITKTKLAKLCYLVDFAWYYKHLEPLTGLEYRKIQQWPVPDAFFLVIDEMLEKWKIKLKIETNIKNNYEMFLIENIWWISTPKLNLEEKSFINKICEKWKYKNTKEIVDFTHNQLPWMICSDKKIIPYNLITQEDFDNVY